VSVDSCFEGYDAKVYHSLVSRRAMHSIEEIISWFTVLKTRVDLQVERIGMANLDHWLFLPDRIAHRDGKYFEIIGVRAEIGRREVATWCQPLMKQVEEGLVGFLTAEFDGVLHWLVQAKAEPGNFDILEMAPTVQCITGSLRNMEYPVPYVDNFLAPGASVRYNTIQSEEGGRFYHEQNRYMVVEAPAIAEVPHPFYCWMTLRQIKEFIKFNNYFNIEARSLVSCISPV